MCVGVYVCSQLTAPTVCAVCTNLDGLNPENKLRVWVTQSWPSRHLT